MDKKTILVVDDEEIICDLLSGILNKLGYNVMIAGSGRQAVDIFSRKHSEIDLAIIDLFMPEMDGYETMVQMKLIDPNMIILLSSGQHETVTATISADAEADGFLPKPYGAGRLAQAIEKAFENRVGSLE
jgi:two-component system cell cycle sensor histidine kinase/response regulator CckA